MKLFVQYTIGTKLFLYGGALFVLVSWLIYFRIINYQYWLQSDWNVFLSAVVLIIGEEIVMFFYEVCRNKKNEAKSRNSITRLPIYDNLGDRDHTMNINDLLKKEMKEQEEIALQEDIEKSEEESWRVI